jgi:hypothetical protein
LSDKGYKEGDGEMLVCAGILFVIALILWAIDKLVDNTNVDFSVIIQILIVLTMILIVLNAIGSLKTQ